MSGRRGHGEGSVFRRSGGGWGGLLDLGWVDGKRRRRSVSGNTRAEVVAKLAELQREQKRGRDLAARPRTVAQWLEEWLRDMKAIDGTRPSSLARYESIVRVHLVPGLGHKLLDRVTAQDVQRLLAAKAGTAAPGTVVKIHNVLRAALSDAERMDLVSRNVAKAVRGPSLPRPDRRVLLPEDAARLLAAVSGDRFEGVFVLALTMGLRRGEVLGLRWDDVNLGERRLTVRQGLQRVGGELRLVELKTHRSRRALPVPDLAIRALERQRARQAADRLPAGIGWQDSGLVFCSLVGTPLEPRNVNRRFEQLRTELGLGWLRLHDLRPACATYLLSAAVEPRVVMDILGHSTIRLTMDTYGHVLPERLRSAADAMDWTLRQGGQGA